MFFSQLCHTVALWPWRMRLIPLCFQVPPEPQGSSAGRGCQGFVWKRCAACWVPLVGHAQCLCRWHTVKWMEAGHPNKMFCIIKVSDRIPSDTLLGVVWRQVRRNEGIPVTAGSAPLKAKGNSLKALHRAEEPACTGCTSLGLFRGSISSPQHRMISCRSTALPVEAAGLDPGCREALLIPAQRPRRWLARPVISLPAGVIYSRRLNPSLVLWGTPPPPGRNGRSLGTDSEGLHHQQTWMGYNANLLLPVTNLQCWGSQLKVPLGDTALPLPWLILAPRPRRTVP